MMVVRLGFAPAIAFTVLASVGTASAQYYPAEEQDPAAQGESAYDATTGSRANENVEVPAAYDPYGASPNGAASPADGAAPAGTYGAPPPGVRDPYAQPVPGVAAQQPVGVPGAPVGAAPVANAPYSNPSTQPAGYPAGAYSGQPPAGMASPYGSAAAPQPTYSQPPAGTAQSTGNSYGANGSSVAMLPPEDQPEQGPPKALPENLRRQIVDYVTKEAPGTLVIDTPNTYLYYVLPGGKAERYGIGVGREGFTWAGAEKISRKAEWPDWRPPSEMIERQPYLPRFMAGGPGNPMGARALYLGGTVYRIHGTNQPSTIGQFMSSGCIRMLNEDVENLYERVKVGTKVVVLPGNPPVAASTAAPDATAAMPVADTGFAVR